MKLCVYCEKENRGVALSCGHCGQHFRLADVNIMDPFDFEQYVGRLLEQQGYKVKITGKPGDLGVDIVAQKGGLQCTVQVKLQVKPVSRRAVSDVVAGKHHYGCNAAMVVTNNIFAKQAVDLAQSTRCILIDRKILARWITSCQRKMCPSCQKWNRQQARFCGYCGKSLLPNLSK